MENNNYDNEYLKKEYLKKVKEFLRRELSKDYQPEYKQDNTFEEEYKIQIEERKYEGDITRSISYSDDYKKSHFFLGYLSYFSKRNKKYAICSPDGKGLKFYNNKTKALETLISRVSKIIEKINLKN